MLVLFGAVLETMVWIEQDDKDVKYGKWKAYTAKTTLAEERKVHPPPEKEVWPHWSEGVPIKLRRKVWSPRFSLGRVSYKECYFHKTLKLQWSEAYPLAALEENYRLLPGNYKNEWSGVYRIFVPNAAIHRCCGTDPTGTLYLGRAGTGRGWSTLRNRIMLAAKRQHHAIDFRPPFMRCYGHTSLNVQWAYLNGKQWHLKGTSLPEAIVAEAWLLNCYNDAYGEYPPWNEKG